MYQKIQEKIFREIMNYRSKIKSKDPETIYNMHYEILFFESYYELISSDWFEEHAPEDIAEWLYGYQTPLQWLFDEWLSCEEMFSEDWDDMINWLVDLRLDTLN